MDHPVTPYMLPHHMLVGNDDDTWQQEASKINVSCHMITQPESVPTNGLHILLKYRWVWLMCDSVVITAPRAWPFVLDKQIQPVVIKAFRAINVAGLNIVSW